MSEQQQEYRVKTIKRGFWSRLWRRIRCHKEVHVDDDGDKVVAYFWPNGIMEIEVADNSKYAPLLRKKLGGDAK